MGNTQSEPSVAQKLAAEAKQICSVYEQAAAPHNKKTFDDALRGCLAKHTSPDAHEAHAERERAAESLTDSDIRTELARQATQASFLVKRIVQKYVRAAT
jgi:hypothetical protein